MLKELIDWYQASLSSGGYLLIGLLMAMESTLFPLPSEFIIPPAAVLVGQSGRFSYTGIILAGTIGSWVGATIMYWASRWAGRPLVMRFAAWQQNHPFLRRWGPMAEYLIITPAKIEKAETWFSRFGSAGVFVARLLPVIRHLIGIPAGIVRLNFLQYSLFTIIGSAAWTSVLVWVGVRAGKDQALMNGELHRILLWFVAGVAILSAMYYLFVHRPMRSREK